MKTKAISSIFLLFTISISMISIAPNAFADHHEITITPISGSGSDSGCELTEEGCYSPNPVTVYVGSVIIFSNTESVSHTFSSGVPSDDVIGVEFNSGMLEPGSSFQWIPENVGEFPYFDMIHPWMQGTIIVQEATEKTHEKMETHSEVAEETVVEEQVVEETVVEEQVVEETVVATQESEENGGGCLIATATYGSELAPQVQLLREIRDNSLLQTESGSAFMATFNDIYYTFSPTIADYERESPIFKEAVKFAITPMITTLSIMENANSESEVLGLGLSIIALNLAMYIGIPAVVIVGIRKRF
ncbi:MAG: putative Blue (Type 1) copper domain protein [Nitrosopumilus sp.]|nr:putative Blue (Type 1) copper domain protein [Candidatus Nitrosopumilus limneticus]